ncbi:hypothetical protein PVNG_05672 [Plasmodium vivax North Korean]|uniref:Fam-l protein n=1 Tax=Plasmodium vivax North Korean TaxID=1035514 RepID=A0A0J9TSR8_PLAVI|nr:hypothetical protein PVNG_05672 [Plasmodium vivax North Korean]
MMKLLGKYCFIDNVKLVVLLKFFTYIFLIWNLNCDMVQYQKYANYVVNKNIKSEAEKKSLHSYIKGDRLNKIDYYIKDYKIRYSKKKGIAKLDCYYERKIFNKINNIYKISKNMKITKKYYKKKKYNKYVMLFASFAVIPIVRLIFILYFSELNTDMKDACFSGCLSKHEESDNTNFDDYKASVTCHEKKKIHLLSFDKNTYEKIEIVNNVFLWISFSILLLVLLYILIKVIKYARIKSGKCKIA